MTYDDPDEETEEDLCERCGEPLSWKLVGDEGIMFCSSCNEE